MSVHVKLTKFLVLSQAGIREQSQVTLQGLSCVLPERRFLSERNLSLSLPPQGPELSLCTQGEESREGAAAPGTLLRSHEIA